MNRFLLVFLICLPSTVFSQSFINKSKKQVKNDLENKEKSVPQGTYTITDNDTTLVVTIQNTSNPPAEFIYHFDKNGKCYKELIISNCDSCMKKKLNEVIALKKYNWKKINENQYVSDFSSKLMIELPPENTNYVFAILKMNWNKQLYDLLMSKE